MAVWKLGIGVLVEVETDSPSRSQIALVQAQGVSKVRSTACKSAKGI